MKGRAGTVKLNKYGVDLSVLEEIGLPALEAAEKSKQVVVIDEIGTELEAQAAKLVAEAGGVEASRQIEAFKGFVELAKGRQELIGKQFDLLMQQMKAAEQGDESGEGEQGAVRKLAGASNHPSPAEALARGTPQGNGAMGSGTVHA